MMIEAKYFVYVLQSQADQGLYIGFSTDLDRRIEQHNGGRIIVDRPPEAVDSVLLRGVRIAAGC
jgi:hypothetical protein